MRPPSLVSLRALVAVLLLGGLLALPRAAHADDEAKARARIQKARKLYGEHKLDQAIAEYLAAYKLVSAPDILFNIAQIYEVKGEPRRALQFYAKYLETAPDGRFALPATEKAEALVPPLLAEGDRARWDEALAATTPEARTASAQFRAVYEQIAVEDTDGLHAAVEALPRKAGAAPPRLESKPAVAAVVAETPPPKKRAAHELPPYARKWWFWTAIGGGAVVLAIVIGVSAGVGGQSDPVPTVGVLR